jgi:hypothetical protein
MTKPKKTSPTQRSLKMLRDEGWICAITEHWNPFAHIRQDLYGFIDILAIREGQMLAVQTTSNPHATEREKKVRDNPAYKILISTGCDIDIHGWKQEKVGKRKLWCCRIIHIH